jgi:hypothetical protein|tara:strand:+ start:1601 stop:1768 length:168 start_codon:yes stop_codon:yes gene_type:complete
MRTKNVTEEEMKVFKLAVSIKTKGSRDMMPCYNLGRKYGLEEDVIINLCNSAGRN